MERESDGENIPDGEKLLRWREDPMKKDRWRENPMENNRWR